MPGSIPETYLRSTTSQLAGPALEAMNTLETRLQDIMTSDERLSAPTTRMVLDCVDMPPLSAEARAHCITDLAERDIAYDELFPEREMRGIIGELELNGVLSYFVMLSDGQAFRVRVYCSLRL